MGSHLSILNLVLFGILWSCVHSQGYNYWPTRDGYRNYHQGSQGGQYGDEVREGQHAEGYGVNDGENQGDGYGGDQRTYHEAQYGRDTGRNERGNQNGRYWDGQRGHQQGQYGRPVTGRDRQDGGKGGYQRGHQDDTYGEYRRQDRGNQRGGYGDDQLEYQEGQNRDDDDDDGRNDRGYQNDRYGDGQRGHQRGQFGDKDSGHQRENQNKGYGSRQGYGGQHDQEEGHREESHGYSSHGRSSQGSRGPPAAQRGGVYGISTPQRGYGNPAPQQGPLSARCQAADTTVQVWVDMEALGETDQCAAARRVCR